MKLAYLKVTTNLSLHPSITRTKKVGNMITNVIKIQKLNP